jgi:hypothetical protein
VSDTSVSRRPGPAQAGQVVWTNSGTDASGERPLPVGRKSATAGSRTGRSRSGTGTGPQSSQCTIGMGGPQ